MNSNNSKLLKGGKEGGREKEREGTIMEKGRQGRFWVTREIPSDLVTTICPQSQNTIFEIVTNFYEL